MNQIKALTWQTVLRSVTNLLPSRKDYAAVPKTWRADLVAGITVGIVALPLALAFGISSGLGAEAGLITAVVAGIVAAVFGGSNVQVSGPTGAMVVVLAPIVATYGVGAVALLSLIAGVTLLILGVSRLGRIVAFLPWPVVEGFTFGIGTIIFLQQVPLALSVGIEPGQNTAWSAWQAFQRAEWASAWPSVLVVIIVAITMLVVSRINRSWPASLIAIVVATVVVKLTDLSVAAIGELPAQLPPPTMPSVDLSSLGALMPPAFAIAALAAIESLLSARVAASLPGPSEQTTGPYNPDRELVGQGLASIAAGFFGGMPATGAIARTAVNVRAGGRTRLSAIIHSLVLIAVIYLASGLVSQLPLAALAGVLMVTASRMMSIRTARSVIRSTHSDAVAYILTALVTVVFDLIVAIQIGVVVAAMLTLRHFAGLGSVRREPVPEPNVAKDERIALVKLDGLLFFGAADRILQELEALEQVDVVILRLSDLRYLDATGAQMLAEVVRDLERRDIIVLIKAVNEQHLHLMETVGVFEGLRFHGHLYVDLEEAIEHARAHVADQVPPADPLPPQKRPPLLDTVAKALGSVVRNVRPRHPITGQQFPPRHR